jgi:hypothetical protein
LEWPEHRLLAHRAEIFKGWLKKAAELRSQFALELAGTLEKDLEK